MAKAATEAAVVTLGNRDTQEDFPCQPGEDHGETPLSAQEPISKVSTQILKLLRSKTDPVELEQ